MNRPSLHDRINQIVEGVENSAASEEVDPGDIRIAAPKEPEVNPEVYRDVENLLFRGFLTLSADINGISFIFKSINHREFEHIQWISGAMGDSSRSMDRYYNTFLAYGVFMIEGENILPDRDQWIPVLQDTFSKLPTDARGKLVRYLSEVNTKASGAVTLTEAYQMESYSRFKWAQHTGLDPMSTSVTGIQGTSHLGLNFSQLVWRALNRFEDLRDNAEREWDNSKFIGSCFAGKGLQKIYSQDKDRRQKEREERIKRRDVLIRQVVFREDPEKSKQSGRYVMNVARSVEELADQLEKNLRGEKDWHDEVVAREEAKLRAVRDARMDQLQKIAKDREKEQPMPYAAISDFSGLSRDEVNQRVLRKRQIDAQQAASRVVYPEMMDERTEGFFQKYMGDDETYQDPKLRTTNRDPSEVRPPPPPRPRSTPFRR